MTTAKKPAPAPVKGKEKQGFEKSLERLEKIVEEMEQGSLGLEDMIARFEEGRALIRFCSEKLNEVEKKIEILVKKGDEITTEPFDAEADEGGEEQEGKKESGEKDELF